MVYKALPVKQPEYTEPLLQYFLIRIWTLHELPSCDRELAPADNAVKVDTLGTEERDRFCGDGATLGE